jgi:hypothetical protein
MGTNNGMVTLNIFCQKNGWIPFLTSTILNVATLVDGQVVIFFGLAHRPPNFFCTFVCSETSRARVNFSQRFWRHF